MNIFCSSCGALHWWNERLSKSTVNNIKFGKCCLNGKVKLPRFADPPRELSHLLSSNNHDTKNFYEHIRRYNDALAMTSVGCTLDSSVLGGAGTYVFKIHGALFHHADSLLFHPGEHPVFGQLYIYDRADALNYCMANQHNQNLLHNTMQILQDMLYHHHPGIQLYKTAFELTRNMPPEHQCTIALHFDENYDCHCYNLPTATSNEIAAIIPESGDQPTASWDIILYSKAGDGLKHISELHPFYSALHYVLLFSTGQLGWHPQLKYQNGAETVDQENADQPPPGEETAEAGPSKRKRMSMREFLAFHLHPRQQSFNHLFRSGKLFHKYLVDS